MAALGVCAAYMLIKKNRDYAEVSSDQVADITFLLIFSGLIGARVCYIIQYFDSFKYATVKGVRIPVSSWQMFLDMLKIYNGGIVFYGGFIFAVIALIIYCRIKKLDFWKITDIAVPGLALGHAFGRIGCFLNGCCFGKPTESIVGYSYSAGTMPAFQHPDQAQPALMLKIGDTIQACWPSLHLHPIQLYEALCNIALAVLLYFTLRKFKRGQNLALYIFLYGIIRFCDEFFRGDHQKVDLYLDYFTPAQFTGLFLIPIGIGLFIYFQKKESGNLKLETEKKSRQKN